MFPDASPVSSLMSQGVGDQSLSQWLSEDMVRIAEYFYYEHEKTTLNLYPDNITAFSGSPQDKQLKAMFGKPLRSRTVDRKKVKWVKTNGFEVLEERDWAGKYIPVVRVIGNEFEVDGQLYLPTLRTALEALYRFRSAHHRRWPRPASYKLNWALLTTLRAPQASTTAA
jgi:hypothetical protein